MYSNRYHMRWSRSAEITWAVLSVQQILTLVQTGNIVKICIININSCILPRKAQNYTWWTKNHFLKEDATFRAEPWVWVGSYFFLENEQNLYRKHRIFLCFAVKMLKRQQCNELAGWLGDNWREPSWKSATATVHWKIFTLKVWRYITG